MAPDLQYFPNILGLEKNGFVFKLEKNCGCNQPAIFQSLNSGGTSSWNKLEIWINGLLQ